MPMTVITLTNVPRSLRGDLTKWLQEISTGVYVGNINSRVRAQLWQRIIDNIQSGQATVTFGKNGELGYDFQVYNTKREVVYYDGIPLVLIPVVMNDKIKLDLGFSNASKYEKVKRFSKAGKVIKDNKKSNFAVIDVETTGLDLYKNRIIEIAAIKSEEGQEITFHSFILCEDKLSNKIIELTSITDEIIKEQGKLAQVVFDQFLNFIGERTLVGYNIKFDIDFINSELKRLKKESIQNRTICLMKLVKKEQAFLPNYKLATVLKAYNIITSEQHRASVDVKSEYELAMKLNILSKI